MFRFGLCLLAAFLGGAFSIWMSQAPWSWQNEAAAQIQAPVPLLSRFPGDPRWYDADGHTPAEAVNIAVYEHCNRSVVNISTVSVRSDRFFLVEVPEEGNGSGAVLDQTGHILTNYHVVQGARQVNVTLSNEETFPATLVGADPVNDIAVIKIDAPAELLVPVTLGDSDRIKVGMNVYALGNPFGLERTMSIGTISSLNRTLEVQSNWVIKSIIQIDASINPGNSGGPLIDSHGRLIGMNTAIASRVAQSAGIGFAIPSNLIRRVVPELITHGRVIRGDIGISHVTVTEKGLRIARITAGGPAEKAGLRGPRVTRRGPVTLIDRGAADIIVAVDGQEIHNAAEFLGIFESKKPGEVVELTILRDGQPARVRVTLGSDTSGPESKGF
ncbi:MAG: trypsin-like peptidase domain-containing protein [Planctomycetaceae bacterium]|nr:trypsin-like peptidase domain-containing protein [Planctomycetaceae bacterium]